ncbi:hypothetical protein SAMN05216456_0570 [Devosia crocina]|uniref:histidine kinase n=1 Tax=Devosia crocina TaxID=429728 RepID=A0A1I7N279_9HYPH|nr:ATP-binding protein [Devosia crocina]SFV28666.1 hypothetical protein SAMN05216456_0570 [Devosia crocina]
MNDIDKDVAAIRQIDTIPSILQVVTDATGMGFAAVARVTENKWFACEVLDNIHFGLEPGGELPLHTTICNEIRSVREEVVIDHVAEDPVYRNHHTPAIYGFQSYISVPIILPDGEMFGTLCAIDPHPRRLRGTTLPGMFRLFAQLIAFYLDANQKLSDTRSDLRTAHANLQNANFDLAAEQSSSQLREQFIAVLGHDLRNPLSAIEAGRRMLEKEHKDAKSVRILRLMGESVERMSGLISNVMDFARGRLGGGIGIERSSGQRIEPMLAQVINEIKAGHPDRVIETRFDLAYAIDVDQARIAQMFSNLLGNAVTHGAPETPVVVHAMVANGHFELAVSNGGAPIPPEAMQRLFQPFARGEVRANMEGLGLGLYIASQIAEAHGGRLEVSSTEGETRFTFRVPVSATLRSSP